jgi:uncharacterized protein
MWPRTYYARY